MQNNIGSKRTQTIVGVLFVAVFMFGSVAFGGDGLSLIRKASAGYGSDSGDSGHHHHKKKKKKISQAKVLQKVNEFKGYNTPANISAYNRIVAIKKASPAKFRAMENVYQRYARVGGRLKVRPSVQTISAINMFKSYNGYATYLNYVAKLKK